MVNAEQQQQNEPLWHVGVPRQTKIADMQRGYIDGWEVPVIMADKTSFTVTIPATDFTPDNVRAVIEEHVERVIGIRTLEGPRF